MKTIVAGLLIAMATAGCGKSWGKAANQMADDGCKCADRACADGAFKAFLKDMGEHKDDVGVGDLDDIGAAEKRVEACIAKLK